MVEVVDPVLPDVLGWTDPLLPVLLGEAEAQGLGKGVVLVVP